MEPCVVVASACEGILPLTIIEGILGEDSFPSAAIDVLEHVKAYPWHLRTKYYDASIHLCAMERKTIGSQEFANSVNAIVLVFDSNSEVGLSNAEQWIPFVNEFDCDVKILVCDYCHELPIPNPNSTTKSTGVDRVTAVTWCIKNGFELVEINPQVDDSDECDLEDDFPETVGIPRIVQALGAHMWPNMIRKGNRGSIKEPKQCTLTKSKEGTETTNSNSKIDEGRNGMAATAAGEEDADDGIFEALFEQLSTMKSKANNMPTEERRDFAEKMAVAFWRAIGGDESEVEGLNNEILDEESL